MTQSIQLAVAGSLGLKDLHKGPINNAAAQVLVGLYNNRLRPANQLPEWTRRSR